MRLSRALFAGGIIGATLCAPGSLAATEAQDAPRLLEASIVDFAFEPSTIEVDVGTTVRWTNEGRFPTSSPIAAGRSTRNPSCPGRAAG